MKTKLLALLCAVTLLFGTVPAAAALEGETTRAADLLYTLRVLENDKYDLDTPATRAQAAVLLVNLSGSKHAARTTPWYAGFRDVPDWAFTSVHYAGYKGWVSGYTATEFRPDQPITANAWFTFLLRMLGYSDKAGDFTIADAAKFARRIGLTPLAYDGTMTQGDLYQSAADALSFSYRDGSGTVAEKLVSSGTCSRATANVLGLLNPELTARQISDRHTAAVFSMNCFASDRSYLENRAAKDGSGFFITSDGIAVTNFHTIDGSIFANVILSTGESYPVEKVLWYDKAADLAVLRVSKTSNEGHYTSSFAHLDLVGTGDIRAGDVVYTLGNPLGLGLAVSSGIISDTARTVDRYSQPCIMNTADISQGSSGGALLNAYGHVVGVTSGAFTYGNNMYLAVPVDPILSLDLSVPGITLGDVYAALYNEQ